MLRKEDPIFAVAKRALEVCTAALLLYGDYCIRLAFQVCIRCYTPASVRVRHPFSFFVVLCLLQNKTWNEKRR